MAEPKKIIMTVTNRVVGYSWLWDYQAQGANQNVYLVPTYLMVLEWIDQNGKLHLCTYEVIRFGIASVIKGKPVDPYVCGLKNAQTYN